MTKSALDQDLQGVSGLERATHALARRLVAPGLALVFLLSAAVWANASIVGGPTSHLVIIAAIIAGYMALNVGANDVANNMGPAVGSRTLSMGLALLIAAVAEVAGALLAGGDVVTTVARELLATPELAPGSFVLVMMAALLASALWVNLATVLGAPVSTTHSIVGGVVGAGLAASGATIVSWPMIGTIAASWVISPVLGGICAAALLGIVHRTVLSRIDKLSAARVWVPVLVAAMTGVFAMYIATKAVGHVWTPSVGATLAIGVVFTAAGWVVSMPLVRRQSLDLENRKKHVALLFRLPLAIAAALLSFAHGANDVANAVGPLAAIVSAVEMGGGDVAGVPLPFWVLTIGAIGIATGIALFGPRLIRTVGEQITRLNEIRAYCVALSAAGTVLAASALGLPVSSTHIAVGAVFGVGFVREFRSRREFAGLAIPVQARFIDPQMLNATPEDAVFKERKLARRRLVRRNHVLRIVGAWMITLPASASLAALLYLVLELVTP